MQGFGTGGKLRLKITFSHYKEHLAPKWREHDPRLRVFLDRNFDREPVEFKLDADNPEASYAVEIEGTAKTAKLSRIAAIGMKAYVTSPNASGVPCTVSAGSDFALLAAVMTQVREKGVFQKEIELRLHSVKNFPKGKITMTIQREGVYLSNGLVFDQKDYISDYFIGDKYEPGAGSSKLLEYINSTLEAKNALKEKVPAAARIRIPAYLGDPGLELTGGVPLPAFGFLFYEVPKTNERFWINGVNIVLDREGWTTKDWPHLSVNERGEVFKALACLVAQHMPYKGDDIDANDRKTRYNQALKVGCENFEGSQEKGAGDCEDLEQCIMVTVDALREAKLGDNIPRVLVDLKRMAYQYISGMSLDSVTSAAVTGANDGAQDLGAHMNLNLFPVAYFKECVERGSPEVAKELPWDKFDLDTKDLPFKVAEGTGMYYSEEHIKDNHLVTGYVYPERCFAVFKKPIFHRQGQHSPFYREGLTLFVPDFIRVGKRYSGFWYCDDKGYRGARFEDLENKSKSVGLKSHPEIPEVVFNIAQEAAKIRSPPMHFELTKVSEMESHDQMERIVAAVAKLHRKPKHDLSPAVMYTTVNLIGENEADAIIETLRRKTGVWKVSYKLEHICDALPVGIRMEVFADPTLDQWK